MTPKPLGEIGLFDHRLALRWLGLLYRKPKQFKDSLAGRLCRNLISKLFQPSPKRRRSGRERRNLGSMDGEVFGRPCNLDSGDPCRNDGIRGFRVQMSFENSEYLP